MNEELKALIVDDEPQVRRFVSAVLGEDGWDARESPSAELAFDMLHSEDWSLVLCDVMLGGENGYQVLRRFKEQSPTTHVILMTGHGTAVGALDATSLGAYDYLTKPFEVDELLTLARSVREQLSTRCRPRRVDHNKPTGVYVSDIDMIGQSPALIEVMKLVGRMSATDLPVLVTGESGTGKEVIASALHRRSRRAHGPFIAVNCGAIPSELIEAELFGHVKGAFTGAHSDRMGLWEEADGGTVLLDEITETSPAFQIKLLRALQEGEIRRVGSNRVQRVDVRVIAASNRRVEQEIEQGRFRQDLFYRLNAVSIHLPPLRERRGDILPLVSSFAERGRRSMPAISFSAEALYLLENYPWPGNIRELENAVVRAMALSSGIVHPEDLPDHIRDYQTTLSEVVSEQDTDAEQRHDDRWLTLSEMEARYVKRVLNHTKGNKQAASRLLNIDPKTIERMIRRYDIEIEYDIKIR